MPRPESNTLYLTNKRIILTSVTETPGQRIAINDGYFPLLCIYQSRRVLFLPSRSTKFEVKYKINSV